MIDSNTPITGTFKVVMATITIAQGYNRTCELMIMKWCTWYGAMWNAIMQYREILVDWARMHDTSNSIAMTWPQW
jgi:hypothetical protein